MAFRSDLEAAHARAQALEGKVAALEAENAELRGETAPEPEDLEGEPGMYRGAFLMAIVLIAIVGMATALAFYRTSFSAIATGAALITALIVVALALVSTLLQTCPPGFVLVLSGRSHPGPDGSTIGFRIVSSGRVLRVPLLESANLLDCRPRTIECQLTNAYSKGGIPLQVVGSAVYRLAMTQPTVTSAIERFLGRDRSEVDRVAKELIEGHLRGVVAVLTVAELQDDHEKVADVVIDDLGYDLEKLGAEIDSLTLTKIAEPS